MCDPKPQYMSRTAKCCKGQMRVWESDERESLLLQMSDKACKPISEKVTPSF